jgi:hypothetical protein
VVGGFSSSQVIEMEVIRRTPAIYLSLHTLGFFYRPGSRSSVNPIWVFYNYSEFHLLKVNQMLRYHLLYSGKLFGEPVVTNSIPCPIEGPPTRIGAPTLNCQSFLRVSLSRAKIIPDGFNGVEVIPISISHFYGFPIAVICRENTTPFVTAGETRVGNSVGYTHFILPVFISTAVTLPLPMPFAIDLNSGQSSLIV